MSEFSLEISLVCDFIMAVISFSCIRGGTQYIQVDPYPAKLIYLNFQPLEVVSRYRDPQPQVAENYRYLFNLTPNIRKY